MRGRPGRAAIGTLLEEKLGGPVPTAVGGALNTLLTRPAPIPNSAEPTRVEAPPG